MSTDLIVALIVIPAIVFVGYLGYWSGHDAGRREANARHRAKTHRHPSSPSNLRLVKADDEASA